MGETCCDYTRAEVGWNCMCIDMELRCGEGGSGEGDIVTAHVVGHTVRVCGLGQVSGLRSWFQGQGIGPHQGEHCTACTVRTGRACWTRRT